MFLHAIPGGSRESMEKTSVANGRECSKDVASEKAASVAAKAKKFEESVDKTLTYTDLQTEHWTEIRTHYVTARINQEIQSRTKAIGAFP